MNEFIVWDEDKRKVCSNINDYRIDFEELIV